MPEHAGVVLTTADITDRHHAEEALRRSELDHRRLLEDLPLGVAIQRDGVFLWVNRVAIELLGYQSREQLLGRKLAAVVHPEDAAATFDAEAPRDLRLLRADGETTLAEVRVLPVVFDGSPASMFLATDVGERRAMTARMMKAQSHVQLRTARRRARPRDQEPALVRLGQRGRCAARRGLRPPQRRGAVGGGGESGRRAAAGDRHAA